MCASRRHPTPRRLAILAAAAAAGALLMGAGAGGGAPAAPAAVVWPDELSGMAELPDGRLLLVDDEERHRAYLVAPPALAPSEVALPVRLDDLEAAAADTAGRVYLLTSHSPTRSGKRRPDRQLLVRLGPGWPPRPAAGGGDGGSDGGGTPRVSRITDLLPRLQSAMAEITGNEAGTAGATRGGERLFAVPLNLEGLAWYPDQDLLLVGARTPQLDKRALVFAIGPAADLFAGRPAACRATALDLGGRGVRGLAYDRWRRGVLVLAGPGEAPAYGAAPAPAVYLWRPRRWLAEQPPFGGASSDLDDRDEVVELEVRGLDDLPQPEAICPAGAVDERGSGPLWIVTEGMPAGGGAPLVLLAGSTREPGGAGGRQ